MAELYPYQLPDSKAVVYAQSIFASRVFIVMFCVGGSWLLVTWYLYSLNNPLHFSDTAMEKENLGEAAAIRAVWIAIWWSGIALLFVGSHMWYTATYYGELAVNPRTGTEVRRGRRLQLLLVAFPGGPSLKMRSSHVASRRCSLLKLRPCFFGWPVRDGSGFSSELATR